MLQAIKELKEQNDLYRKQSGDQQTTQDKQQRTISELTRLVFKNHRKRKFVKSISRARGARRTNPPAEGMWQKKVFVP